MLKTLVHRIQQILLEKNLVLVAIDGFGGAGKTRLAAQIRQAFSGSHIITLDDFATDTTSGADRKRFVEQLERAQERMKERERRAGRADILENWFNVWEKEDADYARIEPWTRADIIVPVAT